MDKYSISCPVCIDTPNDPRILQCGHTICFKCTTSIYAQGQISCPLCKQLNTCSTANALPKNYALQELIEQLQKEKTSKGGGGAKKQQGPQGKPARPEIEKMIKTVKELVGAKYDDDSIERVLEKNNYDTNNSVDYIFLGNPIPQSSDHNDWQQVTRNSSNKETKAKSTEKRTADGGNEKKDKSETKGDNDKRNDRDDKRNEGRPDRKPKKPEVRFKQEGADGAPEGGYRGPRGDRDSKQNKCSEHPAQILDLICYECNGTPVCGRCLLVGSHKGHQHMEIQEYEVIVDKRARKGKLFASLLETTTQFDNFQEAYQKLKNHIESVSNMEVQKQALIKMVESKLGSVQENDLGTYEDALVDVEAELKNFVQQCKEGLDYLCSYFPEISNVQGLFLLMNSPVAPSLPIQPPPLATTTVTIPNFSKLPLQAKTSPFTLCNLWWRLLVYPKGNNVDYLSVYLCLIDEKIQLPGFSCTAKFSLNVVSGGISTKKSTATHNFTKSAKDWGFASLLKLRNLRNKFLVDDCVSVYVTLDILKY
eukprot:Phypoly_transcript_05532.p1 GENE.Phypoly_transcript_05532~~Phypoly_transcript_05532.p1  ORF type:complete len:535 (+),score=69.77 Phypoly_transcript_05532:199-1803(+)